MNKLNVRLTAKETAEKLGFTTTNLKHYASLLEQNGHTIFRNTRNHREYSLHDVDLLTAMKILNRDKSMLLEEAASLVMSEDTDLQAILQLSSERIDANIRVVTQDSEDNVRELTLINTFWTKLSERDKEYMQLLKALDEKLTEQINENKQLKEELVSIRHELEELKTPKIEEVTSKKIGFWQNLLTKNKK